MKKNLLKDEQDVRIKNTIITGIKNYGESKINAKENCHEINSKTFFSELEDDVILFYM